MNPSLPNPSPLPLRSFQLLPCPLLSPHLSTHSALFPGLQSFPQHKSGSPITGPCPSPHSSCHTSLVPRSLQLRFQGQFLTAGALSLLAPRTQAPVSQGGDLRPAPPSTRLSIFLVVRNLQIEIKNSFKPPSLTLRGARKTPLPGACVNQSAVSSLGTPSLSLISSKPL